MFLARTVTHSSVAEAQRQISSAEFTEWIAEYEIEPWGSEVKDLFGSGKKMLTGSQLEKAVRPHA